LSEVGKFLQEQGYVIKVLNTIDFSKSMGYNPFAYIRSEKDILKFVTALISNTQGESKGGDEFWTKAEQLLYQALIGFIWYEYPKDDRNINELVELINMMETREDDESFKNAVDFMFEALEFGDKELGTKAQPNHFAVRQYKKFKLAAGKTSKSILISCGARLSPFDIGEVRDLMMYDHLELDKLGGYIDDKRNPKKDKTGKAVMVEKKKTVAEKRALFVIISDTDSSFNFIVGIMYTQLFNILCDTADNLFGGRLPVHVRLLLDEFANIGLIPQFEKLIATIRSREISAAVILQAQSQLKSIYKDNMDTIIGNCDTTLFLGGKEKSTLKDMAESLGKETIDMFNTSVTRGNQESHGQNYQKLGKELMSVDELKVLPGSKCILELRGVRPFYSDKYDITKHHNYKYLADADDKNTFNVKALLTPEGVGIHKGLRAPDRVIVEPLEREVKADVPDAATATPLANIEQDGEIDAVFFDEENENEFTANSDQLV